MEQFNFHRRKDGGVKRHVYVLVKLALIYAHAKQRFEKLGENIDSTGIGPLSLTCQIGSNMTDFTRQASGSDAFYC